MKTTKIESGEASNSCCARLKSLRVTGGWNAVLLTGVLLVSMIGFCVQAAEKADKALKGANGKDISGVYSLATVDGKKLPATVSHDGNELQVRSGTFTISADGKCASKLTFVRRSGVESSIEVKATSTREGSKLKMQWDGAGTTSGKVEGNTFTMENEGMTFVYKK